MAQQITTTRQESLEEALPLAINRSHFTSSAFDEYQASVGDFQVNVGIVHTKEQLNQISALRQDTYQDKMSYLLSSESADSLDMSSYIFYCRSGDRILASCRYTMQVNGEWESPEITALSSLVPVDKSHLLQVGRLLVTSEYRRQMLSEILAWASSDWLCHNTPYKSYFAICAPALVRFYRHFKAISISNGNITLPERQNRTYRLIYGFLDSAAQSLELYITTRGWSLNSPYKNRMAEIASHSVC